jgi:hypothetical protein
MTTRPTVVSQDACPAVWMAGDDPDGLVRRDSPRARGSGLLTLESDGPTGSSASECRCAASRRAAGSNGMANRDDMRTACGLRSGTRIRASKLFASQLGSRNGKRHENSHHPLSELISPSVGTRPRERGRGGQSTRRPPRPASQPHGHRARPGQSLGLGCLLRSGSALALPGREQGPIIRPAVGRCATEDLSARAPYGAPASATW